MPDRAGPAFAATLYCTVPLLVPLLPPVIVSHDALLPVVHEHPAPAVTVTLPVELPDGAVALRGAMENVQPLPWLTAIVWPPMTTLPVLLPAELAATVRVTVPSPEPLAPEAMVIQGTPLKVVQAHPAPAVTVIVMLPPDAPTCGDCGDTPTEQPPDCVIPIWVPARLMFPVRVGPEVGATMKPTEAPPLPDVAPLNVIHGTSADAVQSHPDAP